MQGELAVLPGSAKFLVQLVTSLNAMMQSIVEHAPGMPSRILCRIERHIGVGQGSLEVGAVIGIDGDAHTDADADTLAIDGEGFAHRLDDPLRHRAELLFFPP